MPEIHIGRAEEIGEGERRIVSHEDVEIGVFRWEGAYFAYRNQCPHQGGPACEGLLMHRVVEVLGEHNTYLRMGWDKSEMHFVCAWHGWEFDLRTGECAADRRWKIRGYRTELRDGELYVHA